MATGDVIQLGSLYIGNAVQPRPSLPWANGFIPPGLSVGGDIPKYTVGKVEIRDTNAREDLNIQWVEINENGKRYFVSDRVLLVNLSWNQLATMGFVNGVEVTIDGVKYKLRSLDGGGYYRAGTDPYSGGTVPNEWDRWICNEGGLQGLPSPTANDLNAALTNSNRLGVHNSLWNWFYSYSHMKNLNPNDSAYSSRRGHRTPNEFRSAHTTTADTATGWRPVLEILNASPTVTVTSPTNNQTLYENSTLTLAGNTTDTDIDDVVTVKYQIDSGTVRNLHSAVSDGSTPIDFSKVLTYKDGVLKDGNTVLTSVLDKDTPHTISVWSEDGKGGKSNIITRTFFVVPNRAPVVTVNPIAAQSELINSNVINVSGMVTDADKNDVTVTFAINGGEEQQIYQGPPAAFTFNILLNDLKVGANTIIVKATDTYNTSGAKTLTINKTHNATPVNKAVALYKITAPTGSAKSILLWLSRTLGTLDITTEVSLTNDGEAENFVALEKTNSVVANGLHKEEFAYKGDVDKTNIVVKITYNRTDASVIDTIKQISGVLF